jgi:hypothetical protein
VRYNHTRGIEMEDEGEGGKREERDSLRDNIRQGRKAMMAI